MLQTTIGTRCASLLFTILSLCMLLHILIYLFYPDNDECCNINRFNITIFYWFTQSIINITFFYQSLRENSIKTHEKISLNAFYYFYTIIHNRILIITLYYSLFGPYKQFIGTFLYFLCGTLLNEKYHLYTIVDFKDNQEFLNIKKIKVPREVED